MSDYDDYDFGAGETSNAKSKGISKETVEQIYRQVLGVDLEHEPPTAEAERAPDVVERKSGRFKQGQSGNPAGRPRKQFSVKSASAQLDHDQLAIAAKKALLRTLTVNKNGVTDQRVVHEIIIDLQIKKAAQGSTAAARYLDSLSIRAERVDAENRAREYAQWKDRKARYAAVHERSKSRRGAINWDCPHPDDIVLEPGNKFRIEGPMTPDDLASARQVYQRVQYWLMVRTYERWLQKRRLRMCPSCPHAHAEIVSALMFQAEQQMLPPRLRMTPAHIDAAVAEWDGIAGRALHDLLRVEAGKLDLPVPPRALRVPFTLAHPMSEDLVPDVPSDGKGSFLLHMPDVATVGRIYRQAWSKLMQPQRE